MAKYSARLQRTASTTLAVGSLTAAASSPRRCKIYELIVGSEATPADNAFLWELQRCTTAGTATAFTPVALDPADPAATTVAGVNHTVAPTATAAALLLSAAVNQRVTMRWVAIPGGELVLPATASNGAVLLTPTSSAVAVTATVHFEEQ